MNKNEGSFRDPDGYIFEFNSCIYRAVNKTYSANYDHLISSGLCRKLIDNGYLLDFFEENSAKFELPGLYKVLKPEKIQFISYPYEWSFSMLKDAALLTLEIQKIALEYKMSLKDASAFNIQFQNGNPIFIDTLSFEMHSDEYPWVAYRQFCQHFLAPLAVMSKVSPSFNRMIMLHLDGLSLDEAAKILPFWSRFNLGLYLHLFLHSRMQKKYERSSVRIAERKKKFSLQSMNALLAGLTATIESLNWEPVGTEWADYTDGKVHDENYTGFKSKVISELLETYKPGLIWDIGSNNGVYSRIAAQKGIKVISLDFDPACVEINYKLAKKNREKNILPLVFDILNPTPSLGWQGKERPCFTSRSKPDMIMALAVIHHLSISANVPLESVAQYFAGISEWLLIEFVPKEDEKVKILLQNRKDVFSDYTQENFERIFSSLFSVAEKIPSNCNSRTLYLLKKRLIFRHIH